MRFKEFFLLSEYNPVRAPYAGGTRYSGYHNLPDLRNFYSPGEPPAGGFSNFQGAMQAAIDRQRYSGSDLYIIRDTLEKFASLVQNVRSAIEYRNKYHLGAFGGPTSQRSYPNADYDNTRDMIVGLSRDEIIGGEYPRIRNEELDRAEKQGIVVLDPTGKGEFAVNIGQLRQVMQDLQDELFNQERQFKSWDYLANKADQITQYAMTRDPNGPSQTKGVNPLGGS